MDGLDALKREVDRMADDAARHAALVAAVEQACDDLRRAGLTPEVTWYGAGLLSIHCDAREIDARAIEAVPPPALPAPKAESGTPPALPSPAPTAPEVRRTPRGAALWTEAEKGALVDAAARGATVADLVQAHGRTELAIQRKLTRLSGEIEAARAELAEGATQAAAPGHAPRMPAADRTCAVPGCAAPLTRANRTGVCRDHNHAADHCGCPQCRRRRETRAHEQAGTPPQRRTASPRDNTPSPRAPDDTRPTEVRMLEARLDALSDWFPGWTQHLDLRLAETLVQGGVRAAADACGIEEADARTRWAQLRRAACPDGDLTIDGQTRLLRALRQRAETEQ